jgi:hypothetical protein
VDFANDFKAKKLPLHTLVNNAGVFLVPYDRTQVRLKVQLYLGSFVLHYHHDHYY